MISYGKHGKYSGKKCFFTHRNPKNGEVWSDGIARTEYEKRGNKVVQVVKYGAWVSSDKVDWL